MTLNQLNDQEKRLVVVSVKSIPKRLDQIESWGLISRFIIFGSRPIHEYALAVRWY